MQASRVLGVWFKFLRNSKMFRNLYDSLGVEVNVYVKDLWY